jgi:hypothetical protein
MGKGRVWISLILMGKCRIWIRVIYNEYDNENTSTRPVPYPLTSLMGMLEKGEKKNRELNLLK